MGKESWILKITVFQSLASLKKQWTLPVALKMVKQEQHYDTSNQTISLYNAKEAIINETRKLRVLDELSPLARNTMIVPCNAHTATRRVLACIVCALNKHRCGATSFGEITAIIYNCNARRCKVVHLQLLVVIETCKKTLTFSALIICYKMLSIPLPSSLLWKI